jgi:hypothetical protein
MATCKSCDGALLVQVDERNGDEEKSLPDDLELSCHCHFHWLGSKGSKIFAIY